MALARFFFIILAFFCFPSAVFAEVDHVIVISIDGGKPASILNSRMPILNRMVSEGASTFQAKTISPSSTLPSHVSMLTGVSPGVHKVTWNYWNPLKGTVKVPTVFSLAKGAGLSTAMFATKDKFKHLEIKNSLDMFSIGATDAISVALLASEYLKEKKPNLLFVHLPDSDVAGHAYGWESPEQLSALENVDQAIGILKSSIEEFLAEKNYAVIVTADHGGSQRNHGSSSYDDSTIPWITWGSVTRKNYKISTDVNTVDTAATALWLLGNPLPAQLEGVPLKDAYLPVQGFTLSRENKDIKNYLNP